MVSIADKLNLIIQIKEQLEDVLNSQGVETDGSFSGIVNSIVNLDIPDNITFSKFESGDIEHFISYVSSIKTGMLAGMNSSMISLPNITEVPTYLFTCCQYLDSVYLPNVTTIKDYAFANCTNLGKNSDISFPMVKTIGQNVFSGCTYFGSRVVSFPSLSTITTYAFSKLTGMTQFDCSYATKLDYGAFFSTQSLKKIWVPKTCTTIAGSTSTDSPFFGCSSDLVMYTDATAALSGWGKYFNYISSDGATITVKYNSTYQDYLNA